jgi:anthranilate phosphoribosyltransferase
MIKNYLDKIISKEDLTISESYDLMDRIMSGDVSNILLSAFLIALKSKGESSIEIAGFAKAMRDKSVKIKSEDAIDVCGTGGDNSGTFNISTAVAFVVAGVGIKVAKHGNRSVSSNSGSADVLKELGVNIEMNPKQAEKALDNIGITFLFAPLYHPAMKFAVETRKELGIRTIFNLLGPLTNPATVKRQMIGTFNNYTANIICDATENLSYEKVKVICNANKYDEILLDDETKVFQFDLHKGKSEYSINSKDFNYSAIGKEKLFCSNSKESAKIILDVLNNNSVNGAFHTIAANSALAIKCAGFSNSLEECLIAAEDSIRSGNAINKLKRLVEVSKS